MQIGQFHLIEVACDVCWMYSSPLGSEHRNYCELRQDQKMQYIRKRKLLQCWSCRSLNTHDWSRKGSSHAQQCLNNLTALCGGWSGFVCLLIV
jgi:hypothetical protein